jgi:hypothetical protein
VRNEELQTVEEERNILHKIKRKKTNWIGQILCRNCCIKTVIEGKTQGRTEMTGS